jgi:hypothetical protein
MAKDRKQRFQTPGDLAAALAPWCGLASEQAWPAAIDLAAPLAPAAGSHAAEAEQAAGESPAELQAPVEPSGPVPAGTPLSDAAFKEKWQQWTAIVEVSLRRRGQRDWINPQAFEGLQKDLAEACQAHARAAEGPRRKFFESLAGLVKPWGNPDTLMQTDPEIHQSLFYLCLKAERNLNRWLTDPAGGGLFGRLRKGWRRLRWHAELRKFFQGPH